MSAAPLLSSIRLPLTSKTLALAPSGRTKSSRLGPLLEGDPAQRRVDDAEFAGEGLRGAADLAVEVVADRGSSLTWPITAPKTSRMTRVRPAETAARRQRTGQLPGLRRSLLIYSLST